MVTKGYIEDISADKYGYEISWITPSLADYAGWWYEVELDKNLKPVIAYMQT